MIVDLFAGPGGWSEGLELHGLSDVGFEIDADACATRNHAGHATVPGDLSAQRIEPWHWADGLIASPPCPAFSAAGNGDGRDALDRLVAAVLAGDWSALREHGPGVWLTLEPGRWIDALEPTWVAFEQVPAVLPVWEAYAHLLRGRGYSAWAGVLSAERYGVPQTRRRAFMLASRSRVVSPPTPSHQAYVPGVPQGDPEACGGLFGGVLPWVSMADACPRFAGALVNRRDSDGWKEQHGERPNREVSEPSPTITGEAHRWLVNTERDQRDDGTRQSRPVDQPAPTLTGKSGAQWNMTSQQDGAVKITVAEALALQSFRPDYPVQGSKTSQFQQIGNAVPPLLAAAVLGAVL